MWVYTSVPDARGTIDYRIVHLESGVVIRLYEDADMFDVGAVYLGGERAVQATYSNEKDALTLIRSLALKLDALDIAKPGLPIVGASP